MAAAGWNALFFLINGRRFYQALQKERQRSALDSSKHPKITAPFEDATRQIRDRRPSEESFQTDRTNHSVCTNQTDESFVSEGTEV